MKQCYEYLECRQDDCIMHKISGDKHCWEVEGTLCNSHIIEFMSQKAGKKIHICRYCIYYKELNYGYNTSKIDMIK